ncbi:hypothetical protein LLH00_13820 [bacterium]|nr:hypothetical protein [bacterium]
MSRRLSGWASTLLILSLVLCLGSPLQAACSGTRGRTVTALATCGSGTCTCTNCTCTGCTNTACLTKSGTLNVSLSPSLLSLLDKMPRLRAVLQGLLSIVTPQTLLADADDVAATATCTGTCSGTCTGTCSGTCGGSGSGSCSGSGAGSGSGGCGGSGHCSR